MFLVNEDKGEAAAAAEAVAATAENL